jgi:hypothetical protein
MGEGIFKKLGCLMKIDEISPTTYHGWNGSISWDILLHGKRVSIGIFNVSTTIYNGF